MLEAPKSTDTWWIVLEVTPVSKRDEVEASYKNMRSRFHPDKPTGNSKKFQAVQLAWKEYNEEMG